MNNDKMKEMFEKTRNDTSQYTAKNILDKPTVAGTYTISIENIESVRPMTLNFDGNNWDKEDLASAIKDADGNTDKIFYYSKDLNIVRKNKI